MRGRDAQRGHVGTQGLRLLRALGGALRERINEDTLLGPSPFRPQCPKSYAAAAAGWLYEEADVVDTTHCTPAQVVRQIAEAVNR